MVGTCLFLVSAYVLLRLVALRSIIYEALSLREMVANVSNRLVRLIPLLSTVLPSGELALTSVTRPRIPPNWLQRAG